MKTYKIAGQVIDSKSKKGVPNLKIEAWDKDLIFNDLVGSAVTDKQGKFQIEFAKSHFRELFLDRRPDLFFKVFRGSQLIKSTEDSVLWNVEKGKIPVTIETRLWPFFNHVQACKISKLAMQHWNYKHSYPVPHGVDLI